MARKPRGRAARGARFDKADPAIDTAGAADENPPKPYTTGPLAPDSQSARDTTRGRTRLGVKRRKRATKHPATGKTVKTGGKAARVGSRGVKRKRGRRTSARTR
jgi:hypothetical protein